MLLENNVDINEFLKIFDKKFANFCDKAPLLVSYQPTPMGVITSNIYLQEKKEFKFDFSKEVSENIFMIKEWMLKNWYPIMIDVEQQVLDYSAEEVQALVDDGMNLDEALQKKKIVREETQWRIEKTILKRDEIFVRNLSTNKFYRYRMKMPTTIFLQRLRDRYSQEEAFEEFRKKSVVLAELT